MKAFFLSRLLREKILLLGLVAVAALIWLSNVGARTHKLWREVSISKTDLSEQKQWLGDRTRIEARAKGAIENLVPSKTFDAVRLQAELDTIAKSVGISQASIDDAQTVPANQFKINTVRFQIRNAPWEALQAFYSELVKRAPYIGIEEFTIVANRSNRVQLTALLKVSSVEIAK